MKKALVILASTFAMSGAFAQASAPAATPVAASATAGHEARVEQRIAMLHSELKITPAQETQWQQFADVMRQNGETMGDLYRQRMADKDLSALDDMKQYTQIAQAHADGMTKLVAAFEPLYSSFSPDQKKVADETFRQHGEEHGGHKGHTAKPAQQ
ncbi:Spy/CpxP family protein refolding chaperone [Trinickia mobilis]|uniref:Spy/CpxP family protein refolding chaperone n=1 Tax=Trinickia mobilis TaxID=2816356 RepID=UPI001A8D96E9|nr:Spy/CpxP family protein refolding chaperone [Trinickia mobilis]